LRADQAVCTGDCGDGIVRGGEECDGNADEFTCTDLGYDPGTPVCNATSCLWEGCTRTNCPDGTEDAGEECDDGNSINDDTCTNSCRDATCGDTITRTDITDPAHAEYEECDDGNSIDNDYCTNACRVPACGDGIVQTVVGEVCDDGAANGTYGNCAIGCRSDGPRCGDGIVNGPEVCDDGINDGTYGTCDNCTAFANFCGDAVLDPVYEQCDAGTASNNGQPPDRCNSDCTLNAQCGDGAVDGFLGEECDNGDDNEDGLYNGCETDCQSGPHCGDGQVNGPELCDDGQNSGQYGGCADGCLALGPYCGDAVFTESVEECDNGTNDGSYGTCNPDCTTAAECGDSVLDGGYEQCDLGAGNTSEYGTCNGDCTLPPYCGDAVVDNPQETCDDGVNNDEYGSCTSICQAMPACGDGTIQEGYGEECDDGDNNDGRYGGCRSNCQPALHCGDGIVSTNLGGEECDGVAFGGRTCSDLDGDGAKEPGDFDGGSLSCFPVDHGEECRLDTSGCYYCGDGTKNGVEDCDGVGECGAGADCGDETCASLGFDPEEEGLPLRCLANCQYDLSGCNTSTCGNGELDAGELCDGVLLGIRTCTDLDGDGQADNGLFHGGTLACAGDCTLDTSGCEYCGDGEINGTELCDGSNLGSRSCTDLDGDGTPDAPPVYLGGTLTCNGTCDGMDESGCDECYDCTDCLDAGLACMENQCGPCIDSSDCCANYWCDNGVCRFEEG
jgi:cysteine-rich repeat protein